MLIFPFATDLFRLIRSSSLSQMNLSQSIPVVETTSMAPSRLEADFSEPTTNSLRRQLLIRNMKKFWSASFSLLLLVSVQAQSHLDFKRTEDVIYGRKFGTALTLDVLQPARTNG